MTMRTVAVVPVRMGSTRLPGKTLTDIAGKPLLGHLLDRLALCRRLDGIVVATSERPENDAIEEFCLRHGTAVFRGAEDDVLGRLLAACRSQQAEAGVVVFGDQPLIDPAVVDHLISMYHQAGGLYDFVGNDLKTTWPAGMDAEVFSVAALADADSRTDDPAIREHGTLYIRQHPERYALLNLEAPERLRRPDLEIEVDVAEDLDVIMAIVEHFADDPGVPVGKIVAWLDANPGIARSNSHVPRRWKNFRGEI